METSRGPENIRREVSLRPEKDSGMTQPGIMDLYCSSIFDAADGRDVGTIFFQLRHKDKAIIVVGVTIPERRRGYGVATYRQLQRTYPEYQLQSSDSMDAKSGPDQEKPDAVYLWEKLASLDLAVKGADGVFRMRRI